MAKESKTGKVGRINELIARFERLWLARDLDAHMALHDEQVVLLWPIEYFRYKSATQR